MLSGDLAPFWRVVDERAPQEMDYIDERMFAQEDEMGSVEQGRQILSRETVHLGSEKSSASYSGSWYHV